jgi:hypothetical protein
MVATTLLANLAERGLNVVQGVLVVLDNANLASSPGFGPVVVRVLRP